MVVKLGNTLACRTVRENERARKTSNSEAERQRRAASACPPAAWKAIMDFGNVVGDDGLYLCKVGANQWGARVRSLRLSYLLELLGDGAELVGVTNHGGYERLLGAPARVAYVRHKGVVYSHEAKFAGSCAAVLVASPDGQLELHSPWRIERSGAEKEIPQTS